MADREEEVEGVSPQVAQQFNQLKQNYTAIANKINELDQERNEHAQVLNSIENLEPTRRCYRLVGGVLIERSVAEVKPAVKRNLEGLDNTLKLLTEQLEKTEHEISTFASKHKIRLKSS